MLVNYAYAADAASLVAAINKVVINPIIGFLFALALAYFFFGLIKFLVNKGKDENSVTQGKSHMVWGIIGMFIMVSVFGIMNLITGTIGADINPEQIEQDVN